MIKLPSSIYLKVASVLFVINTVFLVYMFTDGIKPAINLMRQEKAVYYLQQIPGIGPVKSLQIYENSIHVESIAELDKDKIKPSKYFSKRSWDLEPGIKIVIISISILIELMCFIYFLSKSIHITINKYVKID